MDAISRVPKRTTYWTGNGLEGQRGLAASRACCSSICDGCLQLLVVLCEQRYQSPGTAQKGFNIASNRLRGKACALAQRACAALLRALFSGPNTFCDEAVNFAFALPCVAQSAYRRLRISLYERICEAAAVLHGAPRDSVSMYKIRICPEPLHAFNS